MRTNPGRRRFLLAAALTLGPADHGRARQPAPLAPGDPLPAVAMRGLNGPDRLLSSYAGRRLLINVWASWCGPCRAEAASLERLAWGDAGRTLTVIGISTDDDRAAAERWLRRSNATLSHFIDRQLELEHLMGAQSIPVTVLVEADGRVAGRVGGARDWDSDASHRLIEAMFAARRAPPASAPGRRR